MTRFIKNRMNTKKMQDAEIFIKSYLFDFPLTERISIIERIGKHLRQQNSIETNREVKEFQKQWKKATNK